MYGRLRHVPGVPLMWLARNIGVLCLWSVRYACRDYDQYLASLPPSLRRVSLEGASVFVPSFRIRRPLPPGATLRIAATHIGCRSGQTLRLTLS